MSGKNFLNSAKEYTGRAAGFVKEKCGGIVDSIGNLKNKNAAQAQNDQNEYAGRTYTVEDHYDEYETNGNSGFMSKMSSLFSKNNNDFGNSKKKKSKTAKKVFSYIGKGLLTILLICILTGSIVGTAAMIYITTDLDKDVDFNIRTLKLRYTSVIYVNDSAGNPVEYQRLHGSENRVWVDLKDIPVYVRNAIISTEDKRFYKHQGVDWIGTSAAFFNMFLGDSNRGGSTITQQLIKNITKNDEVSVNRKLKEIFQALELEKTYSKDEILEAYLNVIALGNGCNGIQAAANTYFDKDVSQLSIAEAACIVGITQNPSRYNPLIYPENNKKRKELVLFNMHDQEMITDAEYQAALAEELVFNANAKVSSETKTYNNYYVDQVIRDVLEDLQTKNGKSEAEAYYMVYSGGLEIYTVMDLELQTQLEAIYKDASNFPKYKGDEQPQSACVIMDYEGNVKAVVGGRGEKNGDLVLNRATGSRRQPGSSMKPISAYAPAIDSGYIEYSTLVNDSPITIKEDGVTKSYPNGGTKAPMLISQAVKISSNCVPIRLAQGMGIETSFNFAKDKVGIDLLDHVKTGNKVLDDHTYSMILGSPQIGVTVEEMAAAYAIFGNGGKFYEPRTYSKVLDNDGRIILENNSSSVQAISTESAYIMNRLLREPTTAGGTASSLSSIKFGAGLPVFGKTGSTNDYKDRYFCGGSPYYVTACWFGYDKPKQIANASVNPALQIWKKVMTTANSGKEYKEFTRPDGVVKKEYCTITGQIAEEGCPTTKVGYYKSSSKIGVCYAHGSGTEPPTIIGGGEIADISSTISEETTTTTMTTTMPQEETTRSTTTEKTKKQTTTTTSSQATHAPESKNENSESKAV